LNVKDRAEAVGTFRHVNVFLMETLAKWVPTTPEMEVKVLFGRHLWLAAQMADRLGRRARELRAPLHYSRPPEARFASALAALAQVPGTGERIHGLYAVALDAISGAYAEYLSRTDRVIDEPTVVILEDASRDLERMRADSARLLAEFPALRECDPGSGEEIGRLISTSAGMVAEAEARQESA
jgi:hypothetical protein